MQTLHPLKVVLRDRWPPMSQAQLARALGVNESLISHYLNFRREPPEGFWAAAAAVLGCDPADIRPSEPVAA